MADELLGTASSEQPIGACCPQNEYRSKEGRDERIWVRRIEVVEHRGNSAEQNARSHHNPREVAPRDVTPNERAIALGQGRIALAMLATSPPPDRAVDKCHRMNATQKFLNKM